MKKPEKKAKSSESFKKALFKTLPKLLEKDGSFRAQFITFLKPYFAEKEKTEDRFNILLEEIRILREEGERRWQEAIRRLDEQEKRLEEHSKKLELLTQELISLRKRQDVQIGALGARWGLKTERSFRNKELGIVVYTDVPIWEEEFNEGL
jgi:hypothetical protein